MRKEEDVAARKESILSSRGLQITYYQLVSHAVPGILCLLMVVYFLDAPIFDPTKVPLPQQLVIVAVAILLFAMPIGFLLSGISYFMMGYLVFYAKYALLRWGFLPPWSHLILNASLGKPKIFNDMKNKGFPPARNWARFTGDIEFIIRLQQYGGPRVDDPEWVLAVAILARTLSFLALGPIVLSVATDYSIVFLALSVILLLFTVLAETYRDYSLAFSAEHFSEYKEFVVDGENLAKMIKLAEDRLFDGRQSPVAIALAPTPNPAAQPDGFTAG